MANCREGSLLSIMNIIVGEHTVNRKPFQFKLWKRPSVGMRVGGISL